MEIVTGSKSGLPTLEIMEELELVGEGLRFIQGQHLEKMEGVWSLVLHPR